GGPGRGNARLRGDDRGGSGARHRRVTADGERGLGGCPPVAEPGAPGTGFVKPDRFGLVKELLLTSLVYPPRERRAFLEKACAGDSDLRVEVESLLAQKDRVAPEVRTGALASFAARALADSSHGDAQVHLPDRIGQYRILGIL